MFKQNKYLKYYTLLINKAKLRNFGDEKHHIIPKCLGGNDDENNLVYLTYREHYISHALLTKLNDSIKLKNAFWQMSYKNVKKYFNSNMYDISKREYISRISGNNHWAKTDDYRKKLSDSWTIERRKNFTKKVSGENHWTKKTDMTEHSKCMRDKRDIEKLKSRSKKLFIENNPMKNPIISLKFKKPKEIVMCPFCGKCGGKPVMMRYHFEKCKYKQSFIIDLDINCEFKK